MGRKVHPTIHRSPILLPWTSRWVAVKDYASRLEQDIKIREYLENTFKDAHIDSIFIERNAQNLSITVFAGKPGVIIGRGGQGLDFLRKHIERTFLRMSKKVKLQIQEVQNPAVSASITAQSVVKDTENRMPYRRVIKQHIEKVMKGGAKGVKIGMSGRLNGVEISRSEMLSAGKIPLITLRSNVDYACKRAQTIYGVIGVKVWVYHGESFEPIDKLQHIDDSPKKSRASHAS
ncbi:MAG: 30S ribosomal protein S3 [Candidatus Magasanikbacteria bacterium]|nr:30S ribosomal protein S3 [Candidatus Magasanikbacteria bacterium]